MSFLSLVNWSWVRAGLFTGALRLDRQFWLSQDSDSEDQVRGLSDSEGGEIRGLRVLAIPVRQ